MMTVDMWYGDSVEDADEIDFTFYPNDCEYRGNIYKGGKMIGDYTCNSSDEIRELFEFLYF